MQEKWLDLFIKTMTAGNVIYDHAIHLMDINGSLFPQKLI